jgi:hypothetical protein
VASRTKDSLLARYRVAAFDTVFNLQRQAKTLVCLRRHDLSNTVKLTFFVTGSAYRDKMFAVQLPLTSQNFECVAAMVYFCGKAST